MIEIILNGTKQTVAAATIADVIAQYQLGGQLVVAELNGAIVNRDDWDRTELKAGMKLEIVHFVGGG